MTVQNPYAYVSRESLRLFHEMPEAQQRILWDEAQPHFARELEMFEQVPCYSDMTAIQEAARDGELVEVRPDPELFGIVSTIRSRSALDAVDEAEASVPFLRSRALDGLASLTATIQESMATDERFQDRLRYLGFIGVRPSVVSLTRSTMYQHGIVASGRFAMGRNAGGVEVHSTHEKGLAVDIDHGALLATSNDGKEQSYHRDVASNQEFDALSILLPIYRMLLRRVISEFHDTGSVYAYEEVSSGWGSWHVAFPN